VLKDATVPLIPEFALDRINAGAPKSTVGMNNESRHLVFVCPGVVLFCLTIHWHEQCEEQCDYPSHSLQTRIEVAPECASRSRKRGVRTDLPPMNSKGDARTESGPLPGGQYRIPADDVRRRVKGIDRPEPIAHRR